MGSADTVMKSAEDHDRVAATDNIIALEREGTGIWDRFPSIVIKGVGDYADRNKNDQWQYFAAATTTAGMKGFLTEWNPREKIVEG
ncbi:uncharacterized protein Z518_05113 [Rhinocladiella mackenziei CBS 650.93]|uniref:Uncharacterized protein n=1 Tax=Rhinocladiella mackenziei CBS 650.93 TaxID=1442369 RepID=A0A0D2IVC2_9EURO|nr:uncharacterized protein Z518_05113 [Rhinocladiella mackenziei CBS 650.93]KIX07136.1 hypothetical protein Z518_05113 [Rhinocladiella mackenziei CBS 650.93]